MVFSFEGERMRAENKENEENNLFSQSAGKDEDIVLRKDRNRMQSSVEIVEGIQEVE